MSRNTGTRYACYLLACIAACAFGLPAARCQDTDAEQPGSRREILQQAVEMARRAQKAYEAEDYQRAVELAERVTTLVARAPNTRLLLAAAYARLGRNDEALATLERAARDGLTGAEKLENDAFDEIRDEGRFGAVADRIKESDRRTKEGLEPVPVRLEGVKTVEGSPKGGFPWRIRMSPEADAENPQRLIVWLHPAGGSMNPTVERLAPHFIEHGYSLMVVAAKPWRWWRQVHVKRLVDKTLPDVAKTPGIDSEKPVLFGYSAGGQAALQMWEGEPGAYAGLILDAAYPTDMEFWRNNRHKEDRFRVLTLSEAAVEARTPFFVLVGEADPGARLWQEAEQKWQDRQPLTVRYVAGQGHTWLLGREQFADLLEWLDTLEATEDRENSDGTTDD